ncbi:hypothetical protein [Variovorax boronicumulans]|uniref:hypothetical protein n=1 Tax=Variovorax boronicumulans TaxID=436515 RepID=UPI0007826FE2|nr:hypothetical protein [Variovorax boronicumulans]
MGGYFAIQPSAESAQEQHAPAFHSEWSDPIGGLVPADPRRHDAFVAYAKLVAGVLRPHLLPFLAGGRARVLIGPEMFSFDLPAARGTWISVPEIAACLQLLPWAEPDEAIH